MLQILIIIGLNYLKYTAFYCKFKIIFHLISSILIIPVFPGFPVYLVFLVFKKSLFSLPKHS